MYSEDYTCFEVFAQSEHGKRGSVTLIAPDGSVQIQEAGQPYYAWLKFPIAKNTHYEVSVKDARVSFSYISGCENIMDKGVRYVDPKSDYPVPEEDGPKDRYNSSSREQYHYSPWKNWLNDPNGLCWYKGYYHLYYQQNPHGQEWSNMYWGHAASRDLVHWVDLPIVLQPQSEVLENPDKLKGGAFSGCAVPLEDEVVFYLTRHCGPWKDGEETVQEQWMTRSRDMLGFEEEIKVIGQRPKEASYDFRDPKVISVDGVWYMVLASAVEGKGAVLLYSSEDMEHWEYRGPLLIEQEEGIRCFECPDFYRVDGKFVVTGAWMEHYDPQKRFQMSRYYIGDFRNGGFTAESSGFIDFGSNCYAMQSFEHDGRRIAIGWISDFYAEHIAEPHGAYGSMTIPREVHIVGNKLYMKPVEEIYTLKDELLYQGRTAPKLTGIKGNSYYARLDFKEDACFSILLGQDGDKRICFDHDKTGTRIRTYGVKSQGIDFKAEVEAIQKLEIFTDRRTIEIYINDGEAVGTKLFYHSSTEGCFVMETENEDALEAVEITAMKSIRCR